MCLNLLGGWRNSMTFVLTGLDIEEKADLTVRSLTEAVGGADRFAEFDARLIRSDKPDADGQRRGHRPAAHHGQGRRPRTGGPELLQRGHRAGPGRLPRPPSHRAAGRGRGLRGVLAGPGAGRAGGARRGARRRATGRGAPHRLPGRRPVRDRRRHARSRPVARRHRGTRPGPRPRPPSRPPSRPGPSRRLPLGTIIGARSGDKGGNANVGLWARSADAWTWLRSFLTIEQFRALLPEADDLEVRRFEFPNLSRPQLRGGRAAGRRGGQLHPARSTGQGTGRVPSEQSGRHPCRPGGASARGVGPWTSSKPTRCRCCGRRSRPSPPSSGTTTT